MLRCAPAILLVAGCATEPAVAPVTPAPPTVVVKDEPKAPEPEKKPTPDEEAREPAIVAILESHPELTAPMLIENGAGIGVANRDGSVSVQGSLDAGIISRVIRQNRAIKACYRDALAKQPDLEGRLTVRFVIAPTGDVSEATAETSLEPTVDNCILAAFKRMTFPKPDGGGNAVVRFPLIFTQAK